MKPKNYLPFISILALFTLITFLPPSPATAAETAGYEVTPCQPPGEGGYDDCMYARVYDTDPAGTNVRSGPGTDYSIVKTLPSDRPVLVTITGSVGEWMRIEDPKYL